MQFFTTEMLFIHPPRTSTGHYSAPRRRRYGCRTMLRIAADNECSAFSALPAVDAPEDDGQATETDRAA